MKTTLTPSNQTAWSWLVTTFYSSSVHNPYQARWYNSSIVAKQHHQPNVMYQLHSDSACLFHIDSEITNSVCHSWAFCGYAVSTSCSNSCRSRTWCRSASDRPCAWVQAVMVYTSGTNMVSYSQYWNFNGKIIYKWGFIGKVIYKLGIFHCYVWFREGYPNWFHVGQNPILKQSSLSLWMVIDPIFGISMRVLMRIWWEYHSLWIGEWPLRDGPVIQLWVPQIRWFSGTAWGHHSS